MEVRRRPERARTSGRAYHLEQRQRRSGQLALTQDELGRLYLAIPHLEDEALLRTAVATGMRREDVVRTELKDVDLDTGRIRFWEAKKRREWRAYAGPDTLKVLRQHIHKLPRGTPWLFPSPRDPRRHVSSRTAYNVLQRWLDRAGLKRRPFHALRATCIKILQRRGWTIEQVMEQTGDSFRTIKEHYDTPTEEELRSIAGKSGL